MCLNPPSQENLGESGEIQYTINMVTVHHAGRLPQTGSVVQKKAVNLNVSEKLGADMQAQRCSLWADKGSGKHLRIFW